MFGSALPRTICTVHCVPSHYAEVWRPSTQTAELVDKPGSTSKYHHKLIIHAKAQLDVFTDKWLLWTSSLSGLAL